MKPFTPHLLLVTMALALAASGCKRRSKASAERVPLPLVDAAAPAHAGPKAAPAAATPAAHATGSRPGDKSDQGVYGDISLDKFARYKKWASALLDGSEPEKAGVRSACRLLSPAEKQEFENYCRSCGLKIP